MEEEGKALAMKKKKKKNVKEVDEVKWRCRRYQEEDLYL